MADDAWAAGGADAGGWDGGAAAGGGADAGGGGDERGSGCYTCHEEGHISRDCPNKPSRACHNCGEEGHMSRECPNPRKFTCRICNEEGHKASECSNRPAQTCRVCAEEGHFAAECPNKPARTCRVCNEEGHIAIDCPNKVCKRCKEEGHVASECPQPDTRPCFNCGQPGHRSTDCPEPQKERPPMTCRNCQQEGHKAQDCTNEKVVRLDEHGKELVPVTYVPEQVTDEQAMAEMHYEGGGNVSRFETDQVAVSDPAFQTPPQTFAELVASYPPLQAKIYEVGYTVPTPIQKMAIPIILAGKDLLATSQTGSGKTAAFILPILEQLMSDPETPQRDTMSGQKTQSPLAVIIAPTRELCTQIYDHTRIFSAENPRRIGVAQAYGGMQVVHNRSDIRAGTHVLCAVPGRLKHFVEEKTISFDRVKYLVLDEADRMLDQGFEPEIRFFLTHASMPRKEDRQTLMFSATFPDGVEQLAREIMRPAETVKVTVGLVGAVNADVQQSFYETAEFGAKREMLLGILEQMPELKKGSEVDKALRPKVIIFVEKKKAADTLGLFLNMSEYDCTTMHGDREQHQREDALRGLKTGAFPILVATAVAARGLDIKGVALVINFDLPKDIDDYVHRVGRTGRVGLPGQAISFFNPTTDAALAPAIVSALNACQQEVPDFISNAAAGGGADFGGNAGGDAWGGGGGGEADAGAAAWGGGGGAEAAAGW